MTGGAAASGAVSSTAASMDPRSSSNCTVSLLEASISDGRGAGSGMAVGGAGGGIVAGASSPTAASIEPRSSSSWTVSRLDASRTLGRVGGTASRSPK